MGGAFRRSTITKIVSRIKADLLICDIILGFLATELCDKERFKLAASEVVEFIERIMRMRRAKAHAQIKKIRVSSKSSESSTLA